MTTQQQVTEPVPPSAVELRLIGDREQVEKVVAWLVAAGFPAVYSDPYMARSRDRRGLDPRRVIQRGLITPAGLAGPPPGGQ